MLEKPDLQDEKITTCLQNEYGLLVAQISFLPLGADVNTAVYRVVAEDERGYFVKLRRGIFNKISVALPRFLSGKGIAQIIAPLASKKGQLWADLYPFKIILYPFVAGHNGYEVRLSDDRWREFGRALRRIHSTDVPTTLTRGIRREAYSPWWRDSVRSFLARIADEDFDNPVAIELATFLKSKRDLVLDLVERADRLAQDLLVRSPAFTVCHSDIHAGNVLIADDGALYLVDWDAPILAPKERDLMYVGGGLMGGWRSPEEEETLFYQAYSQTQIDLAAMAYYRYERIIEDIAVYCEQLLLSGEGGEDRKQSMHYLKSNFLPNSTIEIAYESDKTAQGG
jgi:spectinomycin phosphotransferase